MPERSGTMKAVPRAKPGSGTRAAPRRPGRAAAVARARKVDLGGLTDHLGYLMRRAQLWIFQDFARTVGAFDIRTAHYSVMTVIEANPGLTQMALARALGIERARLVHVLDLLEERRLVKRAASATDRRSHALYLTAEGKKAFARIRAAALQHEEQVAARLGRRERRQLLHLLLPFASG
jgi:DNA-binding MarR family transcriptional regulator